jgi:hypothetical protein
VGERFVPDGLEPFITQIAAELDLPLNEAQTMTSQ